MAAFDPADLAPLRNRLALLQLLRLALATVVTVAGFVVPGPLGGRAGAELAALSASYAVTSSLVDLMRRRFALATPVLVGGLVLFDGVYLAAVTALTGGPPSVLSFLILVHVIAVTLLLSLRTGLRATLWHALLLFLAAWLQQAGVVERVPALGPEQGAVLGALTLLAVAAAAAGFSALNEGELRRGKAELRALAGMAARMSGDRRPTAIVGALLAGVADAFRPPRVAVVVGQGGGWCAYGLSPAGDAVEVAGAAEDDAGPLDRPAGPHLVRAVDPRRSPLLAAALPGARNVAVVPLAADGEVLGALAVEWGGGGGARMAARTLDLLGQFAAHAALALRAAALHAEVERLASTDALTGLANRRVFQESLARELALAVRRGEPCSLVVLDVDHFKAVNDTHGHQAGDEVLRQVGRVLHEAARGTDVPARYGGEEFAVVLPSCSPAEAFVVAERLRAGVAAGGGPVPVTVSAGVASFPLDAADPAGLVGAADHALYRAKRAGRDRSMRYRPERARRARRVRRAGTRQRRLVA